MAKHLFVNCMERWSQKQHVSLNTTSTDGLNCCSTHSRLQRCSAHAALTSLNEATFPGHSVFFHLRQDKPSARVLSWTKSQPPQELAKEIAMFLHNSWGKALTSYKPALCQHDFQKRQVHLATSSILGITATTA